MKYFHTYCLGPSIPLGGMYYISYLANEEQGSETLEDLSALTGQQVAERKPASVLP